MVSIFFLIHCQTTKNIMLCARRVARGTPRWQLQASLHRNCFLPASKESSDCWPPHPTGGQPLWLFHRCTSFQTSRREDPVQENLKCISTRVVVRFPNPLFPVASRSGNLTTRVGAHLNHISGTVDSPLPSAT